MLYSNLDNLQLEVSQSNKYLNVKVSAKDILALTTIGPSSSKGSNNHATVNSTLFFLYEVLCSTSIRKEMQSSIDFQDTPKVLVSLGFEEL
ncbi:hypothetical protein NPIL_271531 [Nephila pilipes]|uniref:Uncharacterized protein n=1 Tax=Nephila pilipes TaxID=299642 RepID=A0A8X6QDI8_NEPPI|nr:hypothetical protein NPIL_271531 [Nephila pilipes]